MWLRMLIFLAATASTAVDGTRKFASSLDLARKLRSKAYSFITVNGSAGSHAVTLRGINTKRTAVGLDPFSNSALVVRPPYGNLSESFNIFENYNTAATGINARGDICGYSANSTHPTFGFIRTNKGKLSTYFHPNSTATDYLYGINNIGTAVGVYTTLDGFPHGYVLSTKTNKYTPVEPPGCTFVYAQAINDFGHVCGYCRKNNSQVAFLLRNKKYTFYSVPGATATYSYGVNNQGTLAGHYTDAQSKPRGLLVQGVWNKPGLQTINLPGSDGTIVFGLNDFEELVGAYFYGGKFNGFVAKK